MEDQASCKFCRFSKADKNGLTCRRYPPTTQVVFVPVKSVMAGGVVPQEQSRSMYPRVNADWFCGEYAAALVI